MTAGDRDFQQRLASISTLLGNIEAAADPSVRASAKELVQLLMDLNSAGFERTLELVHDSGEHGSRIIDRLGSDELVASLLVLYGLHPLDLETRVEQAVQKAAAQIRSREGVLELVSIHEGTVRLRLEAHGQGCGSSADALKPAVEETMYNAAPDMVALVIDIPGQAAPLIPLEMLRAARPPSSNGHIGEKTAP